MNEDQLQLLREHINSIDEKIVALLNDRAKVAIDIGKVKEPAPAYDPIRENKVLTHIDILNKGPLPKGSIEDIYAAIITACREIQIKD